MRRRLPPLPLVGVATDEAAEEDMVRKVAVLSVVGRLEPAVLQEHG